MAVQLSAADQALIAEYQKQWQTANAAGNTKEMENLHNLAEGVRANYGFSGGVDGSQVIALDKVVPETALTATTGGTQNGSTGYIPPQIDQQMLPLPDNYTPQGIYKDAGMSDADKAQIKALQDQWQIETANGNTEVAAKLHEQAEAIRAKYGYSGGGDGSGYLPTTLEPGTPGYIAPGANAGMEMSEDDKAKISSLQYQWNIAMGNGDTETAAKLHEYAEVIRAKYGYSGGSDGSQYIPLTETTTGGTTPAGGPSSQTSDSEKYITDMNTARMEMIMAALDSAYEQNVNELNAAAVKIPGQYQAARNQADAQSELQRANFNEYAAASGLNSGAGGQAVLAMGNQLQSDLSGLTRAETDALSGLELQRTQLAVKYRNDIAQAISEGKFQEAQMLYDNYRKMDVKLTQQQQFSTSMAYNTGNSDFEKAMTLYDITGDASLLEKWLTPAQIAALNKPKIGSPAPKPDPIKADPIKIDQINPYDVVYAFSVGGFTKERVEEVLSGYLANGQLHDFEIKWILQKLGYE